MEWLLVRAGAQSVADRLRDPDITLHDPAPVLPRVRELRTDLAPYEAVYVALAEVLDASLVTSDARIARAPGPRASVDVIAT